MSYFNPFTDIIETSDFPHARTLRTGFYSKCCDAFSVIQGELSMYEDYLYWGQDPSMKYGPGFGTDEDYRKFTQYTGAYHLGLYDYLTFMIPKAIDLMFAAVMKKNHEGNLPLWQLVLLFPISLVLTLPVACNNLLRPLVSFALTVASLPVIAVAHAISSWFASPIKSQAGQLQFTDGEKMEAYLEKEQCSYDTINLALHNTHAEVSLKFRQPKQISLDQTKKDTTFNKAAFTALFKLNISNINKTHQLKEDEIVIRNDEAVASRM